MATQLNPYIQFTGNAREAVEFYQSVFGGEPDISTMGDFGATGSDAEKIMHSQLSTDSGLTLMCGDRPPGSAPSAGGDAVSIALSGDNVEELRGYWAKLSADGEITVALEKQMWGAEFGMCTDKFGIHWLVNIGG